MISLLTFLVTFSCAIVFSNSQSLSCPNPLYMRTFRWSTIVPEASFNRFAKVPICFTGSDFVVIEIFWCHCDRFCFFDSWHVWLTAWSTLIFKLHLDTSQNDVKPCFGDRVSPSLSETWEKNFA